MTDSRHKVCRQCAVEYYDTTKRNVGSHCSKRCASLTMTQTRAKNGSYVRTVEQNARLSTSLRQHYALNGSTISDVAREKLSYGMKARWATGRMQQMTIETCQRKYGVDHWTQTPEARAQLSQQFKGREFSDDSRAKMSASQSRRITSRTSTARAGKRPDLGNLFVRSAWEANFARLLNAVMFDWAYEPCTFRLRNGSMYTPDFWVNGVFIEIKGYWLEKARAKFDAFRVEYPHVQLYLVGPDEYMQLDAAYRECIQHWEPLR